MRLIWRRGKVAHPPPDELGPGRMCGAQGRDHSADQGRPGQQGADLVVLWLDLADPYGPITHKPIEEPLQPPQLLLLGQQQSPDSV